MSTFRDPAREWWQAPLYIELESPRTYVDLTAPDPSPPAPTLYVAVAPAQAPVTVEYEVIHLQ
jgi:hypothetical protein